MIRKKANQMIILIFITFVMNFFYPVLRFQNRILNLSFGVILLMIPVLVFYRSFKIKKINLKIISVFTSGIVSFFSAIFILILLFNIQLISENTTILVMKSFI